jgi:hypothetical protein
MAQLVTSLAKQSGIEIDDEPVKKNQKWEIYETYTNLCTYVLV